MIRRRIFLESGFHGVSRQTVSEIWRAFGLKPWRQDEFKISPDPDLIGKIRDLVALDLFAALEAATGKVISDLRKSHTAADFIAFLNKIDREVTDDLDVHVILDNLSTH